MMALAVELALIIGLAAAGVRPDPAAAVVQVASVTPSRFMVQRSAAVLITGAGFVPGAPAVCRLAPSAYGARDGTTWGWAAHGELLTVNMSVINSTHGTCTPPDAVSTPTAVLVEGPGTLAVSMNGKDWSAGLTINYVNLASIALGRRPYMGEQAGELVFRSDSSLYGEQVKVNASLPCVPGKVWHWPAVSGGTDVILPLDFTGLPTRLHNDMNITVTVPDGSSFSVWRRFMRVPPPPVGSTIEPVQLDATRSGILVDGKPWLGRGYYISGLNNNHSIPERQRFSVPSGIAAEITRLTKAVKPGDPPVINMGEIYGLGSFTPAEQIAVLDAAAAVGFKVQYDMTNPGIAIDQGGPFNNDSALHWLRSNVTLVRNHSALFCYYICDDCCTNEHSTSLQSQVYSIIKDLDPYHATCGASDCANSWMFRDVPSSILPTVSRSSTWMERGQPALQLSLDLVMQENYGTTLIGHAGTGDWDSLPGRTLGHDADFVHGMFQEPVINCDGNFNQGVEFPHFAQNGTIPPAWFRSMLYLGAVTANMFNQLVFVLGPSTPFELQDVVSSWAAEELELMPSLYGRFGQRDAVVANITGAQPRVTLGALRSRAWSESSGCTHVVVVNANTSTPSRFSLELSGSLEGLRGASVAQRLFDARYTVPLVLTHRTRHFTDWIGPALTNVYRIGSNCSEGAEFSTMPAKNDDEAFIPWVLVPDMSTGYGDPLAGSQSEPFLGTFATEADCRAFCASQQKCTSYAWGNITTKGLEAWWHRCYGRHDTVWKLTPVPNSYVGRRVAVPPPPPPPAPPAPVPAGVVSLHVLDGAPVNPYLFGYDLEEWGSALNLTFNDTGGVALTEALHPGVLRYPSGTGSNIWNPREGRYLPVPVHGAGGLGGYAKWQKFYPWINSLPVGTFSAEAFVQGLGGKAKRTIWVINVYSFNLSQTCDQIQYISGLPGQEEPGVLLELGNELYIGDQGLPNFPNSTIYAEAMIPIVACARKFMPKARVAACGGSGAWNDGLRPYFQRSPPMFDGLTHHNYSPSTKTVTVLPAGVRVSYVAGYSRAAAEADVTAQYKTLGTSTPLWLTEFGYGLDADPTGCLLPELTFGGVHGAFHAGRILAAINTQIGCSGTGCSFGAVTFETFVFRDPPPPEYPTDWCGMPAGTATPGHTNRPDLVRVTGTGQLVAHLSARALAMETMHAVNISGGPMMQVPILDSPQPCLQAAAFRGLGSEAVFVILNICNSTIAVTLDEKNPEPGKAIVYDLLDAGGKASLPVDPNEFPWPAPLTARQVYTPASGVYTASPLSFAIVESGKV